MKSAGTLGQVATVAIDGGNSQHTGVAYDGMALDFGQNPSADVSLLPIEFAESVDVFRNNLVPFGYSATAGLIHFNAPKQRTEFRSVEAVIGSLYETGIKLFWNSSAFRIGASVTISSNLFGYRDEFGQPKFSENLDYRRYALVGDWEDKNIGVSFFHTGRSGGAGNKYSDIPRQTDYTAGFRIFSSGAFEWEIGDIFWHNEYWAQGQTASIHQNDTLTASIRTKWKPFEWLTIYPKLASKTYLLQSSTLGWRWDEEACLIADTVSRWERWSLNLTLNQIVRFTRGYEAVPALNISFRPAPDWELYGSMSRQFRFPSFNDLYWKYDGFSQGNSNLLPETGLLVQVGAIWSRYPISVSAFFSFSRLDNLILWQPNALSIWMPSNIGKTESFIAGVNACWEIDLGWMAIKTEADASFNKTMNADPASSYFGKQIPYTSPIKFSIRAEILTPQEMTFRIQTRFVGERPINELNSKSLTPYCLMDAGFEWKWFFVALNNILNANYSENDGYPLPGIQVKTGVRFQW